MPPAKPIKRYTGAADGRTIGMVLNEIIDEVNLMGEVVERLSLLAMMSDIKDLSRSQLIALISQIDGIMERNAKKSERNL